MDQDTVLLPICVAIALFGVIFTGLAWRRGNKGRVLQGAALAIVPFGLYLTGLLGLVWNAVVAIANWAVRLVFSPTVWLGMSILGLCLVLFVVGALLVRFGGEPQPRVKSKDGSKKSLPRDKSGSSGGTKAQASSDPEMDEIEALLKSRGIE